MSLRPKTNGAVATFSFVEVDGFLAQHIGQNYGTLKALGLFEGVLV